MRNLRRILSSLTIAVVISLMIATPVLAIPSDVTNLKGIPTDTTMSLTWVKGSGSTTVIRYSTTAYPATPADGTSVYSGAGISYKQTGLIAGTTYYYTAWSYDGVNYSPDVTAATLLMTTTAGTSAGSTLPTPTQATPTAPSSTGWFAGLQPFSGLIQDFGSSWGMASNMMPFTLGIIILLAVGILIYLRTKSPFVAICADFILDFGLVLMGLLSPFTIAVVLVFGLGIWALENTWI